MRPTLYAIAVELEIAADRLPAFLPLVHDNARHSADEAGCLRFDVLVPDDGASRVFLYEIYRDRAAFDDHLATDHFRRFDDETRDMILAKRVWSYDATCYPGIEPK